MSYIGTQPVPQSLESRQEFTATASQTTFATNGYTVGYVDVYLNGVKLSTSDFTATNGSDVVLGSGAAAGDVLAVVMKNDHSDLVALPITDSAGNNVLSESSGTVTLTADEANVGSNAFVVDSSGNVGVGTSSPQGFFDVSVIPSGARRFEVSYENSVVSLAATSGATGTNRIENLGIYGDSIRFYVDNTTSEAMRIDSSGHVLIGSNLRLTHIGGYAALVGNAGTGGIAINVNQPGIVPATTAGEQDDVQDLGRAGIRWDDVYATNGTIQTSDATEKENITTSDLSLDFIQQLNPVSYRFIGKTRTHYGLIAQEIDSLLSAIGKEATDFAGFIKSPLTDEDGNETGEYRYGLRYTEFISPMIKAIQEQQTIIESQQSQIEALTAKTQEQDSTIASLISRIEALETPAE
jgi:hypothetical protein